MQEYIERRHRILMHFSGPVRTRDADLALLYSNCHRVLIGVALACRCNISPDKLTGTEGNRPAALALALRQACRLRTVGKAMTELGRPCGARSGIQEVLLIGPCGTNVARPRRLPSLPESLHPRLQRKCFDLCATVGLVVVPHSLYRVASLHRDGCRSQSWTPSSDPHWRVVWVDGARVCDQ